MKQLVRQAAQIFGMRKHSDARHDSPTSQREGESTGVSESLVAPNSTGYDEHYNKPGFRHDIRPGRHHLPPHHHHGHHGFPGLNSPFGEALCEYSGLSDINEVKSLVAKHSPELMPALERIFSEGIVSPSLAVDLLQIEEASERLQRIRELIILASQAELLVILPLPPHIINHLARHTNTNQLLTASHHLPPHLHGWPQCKHIDDIMPDNLLARLNSTKAIAVEGMFRDGDLCLPTNVIKFLYIIKPHYPGLKLYIHNLPHPPRHINLAKFSVNYQMFTI